MKTLGFIGGMSWESTMTYYKIANETVKEKLGGLHSAKILLHSVDFHEVEECQSRGEWEKCGALLGEAARGLEQAGADFIVICTNTMHKVVPFIQKNISIPVLHIADAAAEELKEKNVTKPLLLGTKYTMTQDFYKDKLKDAGLDVRIPSGEDMELINSVIYNELCLGRIRQESREKFRTIIEKMAEKGADGVILGCTEIGLLVNQEDSPVPVFDTAVIHAGKAARKALSLT